MSPYHPLTTHRWVSWKSSPTETVVDPPIPLLLAGKSLLTYNVGFGFAPAYRDQASADSRAYSLYYTRRRQILRAVYSGDVFPNQILSD
jgi:hypothetical protein